jgi:hypothetical protein
MSQRMGDQSQANVVLIERNGRFFFFQPDIGVIASDQGIEEAYGRFSEVRRAFWNDVSQAGLTVGRAGVVAGPSHTGHETVAVVGHGRRGMAAEIGLFVAKVCIVFALIGAIGVTVVARAGAGIATMLQQVELPKQISLADVSRKAADIVKDIQSLTKEEKESLVRSVAAISRELDPVVDAWRNPTRR